MNLSDKIELETSYTFLNENLNEVVRTEWVDLGKCLIMPNTSAAKVKGNDGKEYIYSYEIILRKPRNVGYLPKENATIRIKKKDGSIEKTCKVSGFVTLRNWIKVWV